MTDRLPPNLLKLFAPRPPLPHVEPVDVSPEERRCRKLTGVAQFMSAKNDAEYILTKTAEELRQERREKRKEEAEASRKKQLEEYDPTKGEKTQDPYKTIFVGRLSPKVTNEELRAFFEAYGPIKDIKRVERQNHKLRTYAFVEFEEERDMDGKLIVVTYYLAALERGNGAKLQGQRILLDVERGRTVKGWLPRRLGGGPALIKKPAVAPAPLEPVYRREERRPPFRDERRGPPPRHDSYRGSGQKRSYSPRGRSRSPKRRYHDSGGGRRW